MKNRRFLSMVLCFVLVASLFTGFVSTASADDVITHTVKNNEYLFKICKAYGLDYYQCKNAIMILNGYTSELQLNRISVGQTIKLPATNAIASTVKASSSTTTTVSTTTTINGKTTTTTSSSTVNGAQANYSVSFYLIPHVVKTGETLASICNTYGTNYTQYANMILGVNSISSPNYVWAGKTIYIPSTKAPTAGSCYAVVSHTVQTGETLTSICSAYGTSYAANMAMMNGLNYGKNLNTIYAGQSLYVPIVATVGGSGSGSVTPTAAPVVQSGYDIKFNTPDDGNPYAIVNDTIVSKAEAGKTVTVIGNADAGYALKSVVVTRLDTNANVIVKGNSFVMPDTAVKVTVAYSTAYRLTKEATSNGSFAMYASGASVGYANYGDVIQVVASPKDEYSVQFADDKYQIYYVRSGESDIKANRHYAERNNDGTYSFNMPNYDVVVHVIFAKASYFKLNSKSVDANALDTEINKAGVSFSVGGTTATRASKNATVSAAVTVAAGWKIARVDLTNSDGSKKYDSIKVDDTHYKFVMPAAEVVFKVILQRNLSYKVGVANYTGGTVTVKVKDQYSTGDVWKEQATAKAGDTVRLYPLPKSGYKANTTETMVKYANGNVQVPFDMTTPYYQFTMPENEVVACTMWTKDNSLVRYDIRKGTNGYGTLTVEVTDDGSTYYESNQSLVGKNVKVTCSPVDGYIVDTIKVNGKKIGEPGSYNLAGSGNSYTFTMPAEAVGVEVTFKLSTTFITLTKPEPVKKDGVSIGNLSTRINDTEVPNNAQIRAGSVIVISIPEKEGYKFDYLQIDTGSTPIKSSDVNSQIRTHSATVYVYTVKESDTKVDITVSYTTNDEHVVQYSAPDTTKGYYTISVNGGTGERKDVKANNGQRIKIKATPESGYAVDQIIVDYSDVTADATKLSSGEYEYEFTMGSAKVVTQVTFKEESITSVVANAAAVTAATEAVNAASAANTAKSAADSVTVAAEISTAEAKVSAASTVIADASATKAQTLTAATEAETAAASARTVADDAQTKANDAYSKALTAKNTAQVAIEAANAATDPTAKAAAQSAATAAQSAAADAETAAANAQTKADAAYTAAEKAEAIAYAARTVAESRT